jgi:polygalacturonase/pectin methylesterase-like acyl-CoA thioesterase
VKKRISSVLAAIAGVGTILAMSLVAPMAQASDLSISAPSNLAMAPASNTDTSVVLTWDKPGNYSNISRYNIYLGGALVGATDMTYYKVEGLAPSSTYDFTVRSVGEDGTVLSSASNALQAATTAVPKKYDVKDFGATGNGVKKDTTAIQKAIDACIEKNCEVYLPSGTYLSGALNLHSDMTFYVDSGAQLKPSTELADYPFTDARHDIEDLVGKNPAYSSLLNAGKMDKTKGVTTSNIKILGPGTIGDEKNGQLLREAYDSFTNEGAGGDLDIPPDIYQVGQHVGGGSLISLKNCGNVYMDDIHIRNGMMWTIVPVYSKNITAYGLDLVTSVHNGDGFDPNSSQNVWILGTTFSTGDDNSAIKSGKDAEGIAIGRPSDHLYYRGDVFNSGHGGVTIGSEMSGGVSDVFVEDSTIVPVDLTKGTVNPGLRVKVSPKRSGYVKNIQIRDSVVNMISVITNYDNTSASDLDPDLALPDIENFRFTNVVAPNWNNSSGKGNIIDVSGSNFSDDLVAYLKNFQFDNCKFYSAKLDTAQNMTFRNTELYQGMVASRSQNVTQNGKVFKDSSFPVNDEFTGLADGADLPTGWSMHQSDTGGGASVEQQDDNSYLVLTDKGKGYETLWRSFTEQNKTINASFSFRIPQTLDGISNSVISLKDAAGKNVSAGFGFTGDSLTLSQEKGDAKTVISGIEPDKWYTVSIAADIAKKKLNISSEGQASITDADFSSSKAAGIGMMEVHLPNGNTSPVSLGLDNVKVSADTSASTAPTGVNSIVLSAPANKIDTKSGTLHVAADVSADSESADKSVTWSVTAPDMSSTSMAAIDQSGVLTAKENGTVLAVATAKDGSGIRGIYPVVIANQQTISGLVPVSLTTTVGTAPVLPAYVYQQNSDGTTIPVDVTWAKVQAKDYAASGTFTVKGTVENGGSVTATVSVSDIGVKSIKRTTVKTVPGSLKMPLTVTAVMNDGSQQRLSVQWDLVALSSYAKENLNVFTVEGKVAGSSMKAIARVLVLPEIVKGVTPTVVAADGSGDFRTVGEAIASIPQNNKQRRVIFVKRGTYKEKLVIDRPYVTLVGESTDSTILTYDDKPSDIGVDGKALGTYKDYSVRVTGHDFSAKNITFQTTAGSTVGQAVALDVSADHAIFENCNVLGYQDTLLLRNKTDESQTDNVPNQPTIQTYRSYFKNCYITGSVDYIFGAAQAVFDNCTLHSNLNGYVTAASTPQDQKYGFVYRNSKVTGENPYSGALATTLGRPWRPYASTVFLDTEMDRNVVAEGWNNWGNEANEKTARYVECGSTGEGFDASKRVGWVSQTCDPSEYTLDNIFSQVSGINVTDDWDPTQLINPAAAPETPVAVDASAKTLQGIGMTGSVAAYAQASDDGVLSYKVVQRPAHGILTFKDDGSYSYLPDPGFSGKDTFTFKALNGAAESNEARVTVNISGAIVNPDSDAAVTISATSGTTSATLTQKDLEKVKDNSSTISFDFGLARVNVPFVYARMLMGYEDSLRLTISAPDKQQNQQIASALGSGREAMRSQEISATILDADGSEREVADLPGPVLVTFLLASMRSSASNAAAQARVYRVDSATVLSDLGGTVNGTKSASFYTQQTGLFTVAKTIVSSSSSDNAGSSTTTPSTTPGTSENVSGTTDESVTDGGSVSTPQHQRTQQKLAGKTSTDQSDESAGQSDKSTKVEESGVRNNAAPKSLVNRLAATGASGAGLVAVLLLSATLGIAFVGMRKGVQQ